MDKRFIRNLSWVKLRSCHTTLIYMFPKLADAEFLQVLFLSPYYILSCLEMPCLPLPASSASMTMPQWELWYIRWTIEYCNVRIRLIMSDSKWYNSCREHIHLCSICNVCVYLMKNYSYYLMLIQNISFKWHIMYYYYYKFNSYHHKLNV